MQMICICTYIQIWIKIDRVYNPSLYIYLHIKTDTENKHTFELMFNRMSSNKQMSAMPRFRRNSLVAYNAALSGQGSDHGWWLCLSMLEAGWIFNGLLWLGYAWNPGIDSVRCEFEQKFVIWQAFRFFPHPAQAIIIGKQRSTKTMKKQNSTHWGIWWNQMECDGIWWNKPQLHDLIWLRKPLPQNAGDSEDLGSRADVVTCGTVSCQRKPLWVAVFPLGRIPSTIGDYPLDAAPGFG